MRHDPPPTAPDAAPRRTFEFYAGAGMLPIQKVGRKRQEWGPKKRGGLGEERTRIRGGFGEDSDRLACFGKVVTVVTVTEVSPKISLNLFGSAAT